MQEIRLQKFVDRDALVKVFRRLSRRHAIFIGLFDLDHNVIAATEQQALCLNFHSRDSNLAEGCRDTGEYLEERVSAGKETQRQCLSGLWDIAVPIEYAGNQVARLFVGQFFYDDAPPDTGLFRRWALDYDLPTDRYMKAVKRIPVVSRSEIQSIVAGAKEACEDQVRRAFSQAGDSTHAHAG